MIRILGVILALFRLQTLSAQLAIKIKGQPTALPTLSQPEFPALVNPTKTITLPLQ